MTCYLTLASRILTLPYITSSAAASHTGRPVAECRKAIKVMHQHGVLVAEPRRNKLPVQYRLNVGMTMPCATELKGM